MPSEQDLIAAIESTLHMYGAVPGMIEDLDIAGVRGRITPLSHPLANILGLARLNEGNADATIERVKERYGDKAFGWVVGPNTIPTDLPSRLQSAGLVPVAQMAGMALTDLDRPIFAPQAHVEEVTMLDAARENDMMARAYGMPPEMSDFLLRVFAGQRDIRSRGYFAYQEGRPVAWGYLVYVPESPIVLLGGAATIPEARGHGLYTALVKRRLDDARADGREAAVIQADRTTSAPICAKLGFRELCSLEFYALLPEPHSSS